MTESTHASDSRVVVQGFKQWSINNPEVKVFWKGNQVGSVKRGDSISFEIDSDGEVSFKWAFRSASVGVAAGEVTTIELSWSRLWGTLRAKRLGVPIP